MAPGTNIKCKNILIIGSPEGEGREKGIKTLFEKIMAENILKLGKKTHI